MRSSLALGVPIVVSLFLSTLARADVPPDPDSIDAHCTPAEQCPSGVICERAVMNKELGAACRAGAVAKKLELRCGKGATRGEDLFCPAGEKGTWSKAPSDAKDAKDAKPSKGCAVGGGEPGFAWLGVVALAGIAWRRARRRAL